MYIIASMAFSGESQALVTVLLQSQGSEYMHETLPFITICIPVYNSSWSLNSVLESILNIDYPKRLLRLVFVDGYSTDGTWETLQSFKEKYADQYESIILVRTFKRGIGRQRNLCLVMLKVGFSGQKATW
jgi:cellulose synthase/poly-beta-1,6-N-acetylglucosamine synthase-like glycosyltransferase